MTEKVRSAGDVHFSELCDRIGFNTITATDIEFLKSRDIPCELENDPENFKQGKVNYITCVIYFYTNMFKVAYIVAGNKRRNDINLEFLRKFYKEQDVVTHPANDKLPIDAHLNPDLPYTQTGGLFIKIKFKSFRYFPITNQVVCLLYSS